MTRLNYFRFIKNFLLNNYSFKHTYRPLNAQIEITLRCNARCVFCSIWKKEFQKELTREMTTDEIKHIIDGLDKLGVFVISFTGGEPLLRKDLGELVTYAKKKGMMPAVVTNGYYLYDKIISGELDDAEWFMVSLDWPFAELHDKYRRLKVFDRAIKGIRAAVKRKKHVVISTVITKDNMKHMEDMCKLGRELGAMVELLPCEDLIREQDESVHVVEDIDNYIPDLHEWANEIRRLEKIYPNLTTDSVTANIIEAGGFGNQNLLHCVTAKYYIFIKYNGDMVLPCKIHPILKINVRDKISPYDAYYTVEAKKIMDMKDGFPFCKGCRLGCAISTSIPSRWPTLYQKYMKLFFNGNLF